MSTIRNSNLETLVAPAAIFNAEIVTDEVLMDNFQAAHFIITSGDGATATVNAQVIATDEEGENEKVIAEQEITIGGKTTSKIVVDADKIAHDNFDRVYLKIANAGKAGIYGCVNVIQTNERYNA